jgi:hypothetical protein
MMTLEQCLEYISRRGRERAAELAKLERPLTDAEQMELLEYKLWGACGNAILDGRPIAVDRKVPE